MEVALVEKELAEIWRRSSTEDHPVVRACILNLVVVTAGEEDRAEATKTIAGISECRPGRAITITEATGEGSGIEAYVSSHCHRGPEGATFCTEQINLAGASDAGELIPGAVLHLLCEDLPVFTWWRRTLSAHDPLLRPLAETSDRFIVDTANHPDPAGALTALDTLASDRTWSGNTGDLAWARLGAWRELLASFFDSAVTSAHCRSITSLTVRAGGSAAAPRVTAAGAYVAGWIASRLGFRCDATGKIWRRADETRVAIDIARDPEFPRGEISSVRIEAKDADPPATFIAERLSAFRPLVRLTIEIEGTCPLPRIQQVGGAEEAAVLCDELDRDAKDPVFEAALAQAARMARGMAAGKEAKR